MPPRSRIADFLIRLTTRTKEVQAGTETDFFVARDANRVEIKPGVKVTEETGADGTTTLRLVSTGFGEGRMYCRCPKGYSGSCEIKGAEGMPERTCKGTCSHSE